MLAPGAVLSSTAVATANTSMTGTVVECRDSAGIVFTSIGNVTLRIIGKFDCSPIYRTCMGPIKLMCMIV